MIIFIELRYIFMKLNDKIVESYENAEKSDDIKRPINFYDLKDAVSHLLLELVESLL